MSPLTHKLLRDLWRMKGQALAIAAVIAVGVLMLVMMTGLLNTLTETRRAYYERYRLADVFAPVVRAPNPLLERIADIPGVATVEGRVTGSALIDIEGETLPIRAMAVSLADRGQPKLNDIYLSGGRWLDPDRSDEVILLKGFATARGIGPGDKLAATMNGARRFFDVVGIAESPEFLYTTPPGETVIDDRRFAVIWMSRSSMSAAYDMDGAFNEALIGLERGADTEAVLAAVDLLLDPRGGLGAYPLRDLISNRYISQEIDGLRTNSRFVPPIFLAVAAFLLYIVISRMVQAEREEIGLLKAFGYTSTEVSLHYLRFILAIALFGAVVGSLGGIAAGRAMAGLFQQFYKFPFLVFQLDPQSFVIGVGTSVLAASAGAFGVLRQVFRLTPAVAMRPPAPADYSRTGKVGGWASRVLDQPTRMVLRRLQRQPWRMAAAVAGIAAGMALSVSNLSVMAGFQQMLDVTFTTVDRSDAQVIFLTATSDKTVYELGRMPGVEQVEPFRAVSVVLKNGPRSHRGAITALVERPQLGRALDAAQRPIPMPGGGIVLSNPVANVLQAGPGDVLTVEVREGRRPVLTIPVAAVADSLLGSPTYMRIDALNRVLKEPGRASGAYIRLDANEADTIYTRIKDMPAVAGITLKSASRASIETLMNQSAGVMRFIMLAVAIVITFGIVYNSARIAMAERARDLASLRVIGFTRGEASFVLLGELAVVTLLALPLGAAAGYWLTAAIARGFSTEMFQIPVVYTPETNGTAGLAVLFASVVSGLLVKRDIDRLDLVESLKTRE